MGHRYVSKPLALIASLVCASAWVTTAVAGPINVTVTGARNDDGVVRCGLFSSAAGFPKPENRVGEAVGKVSGGTATCSFKSVPSGTYAVAVFHAEHNEMQLQYGLFGKPKQGVGFSRNPSITFGQPSFNDAAFQVGNAPVSLNIRLNY